MIRFAPPHLAKMSSQDRWKEFEVGKDAILRLEQESEQVDHGYHGCDKGFVLETDLSE